MSVKHTPGPWSTGSGGYFLHVYSNEGKHIASVNKKRDVALVASAPDLLKALEEAIEWNWCDKDMPETIIDMVTAAIAKARGEA